jgi:hypothetical protein
MTAQFDGALFGILIFVSTYFSNVVLGNTCSHAYHREGFVEVEVLLAYPSPHVDSAYHQSLTWYKV